MVTKHTDVLGHFEPEVSRTFLPGCRNCGGSHPLARKGNHDPEKCPDCGEAVLAPGKTYVDRADLSGSLGLRIASVFLSMGKTLTNLAKKV